MEEEGVPVLVTITDPNAVAVVVGTMIVGVIAGVLVAVVEVVAVAGAGIRRYISLFLTIISLD